MKSLVVFAAVLLLIITVNTSHLLGRSAGVDNTAHAIAPLGIPSRLDQSDEAGPEVKLVLLALWPEGLETNEMKLEPGEYLFIMGNRTGLREVDFQMQREGRQLAAAKVAGRQKDFKQRLRLTPGIYIVTANDNPEWTCRITVGR